MPTFIFLSYLNDFEEALKYIEQAVIDRFDSLLVFAPNNLNVPITLPEQE